MGQNKLVFVINKFLRSTLCNPSPKKTNTKHICKGKAILANVVLVSQTKSFLRLTPDDRWTLEVSGFCKKNVWWRWITQMSENIHKQMSNHYKCRILVKHLVYFGHYLCASRSHPILLSNILLRIVKRNKPNSRILIENTNLVKKWSERSSSS
jgi:hypothetical protein